MAGIEKRVSELEKAVGTPADTCPACGGTVTVALDNEETSETICGTCGTSRPEAKPVETIDRQVWSRI